MGTRRRRQ